MSDLAIAPVLVPLVVGVVLLLFREGNLRWRRGLGLLSVAIQVLLAMALLDATLDGAILTHALGNWPAPYGIVLVADRLAAWMLLITALLALFALWHACQGLDAQGRHFHILFQLQLFGLNGAFLTGDLFNLFVFFEVLLLASYGLALHGGGAARILANLHYVVINLAGSALFLTAAGLLYGLFGTLNLAHLALLMTQTPEANWTCASGSDPCTGQILTHRSSWGRDGRAREGSGPVEGSGNVAQSGGDGAREAGYTSPPRLLRSATIAAWRASSSRYQRR